MNERLLQLIGLAFKAGKLKLGSDTVMKSIRQRKVQLVFFASDGGTSQRKQFYDKSKFYEIPFSEALTKAELSQALGKARSVIGVADAGFAKKMKTYLEEEN